MNENLNNKQTLCFKFDVSTFRLLGRELITDRITALFELVKNSYDANAENVTVEFYNVGKISKDSKIIIRDDGIGMTLDDIRSKWMVIGTNNKRQHKYSPAPYNRTLVGEKGIGRFAVDKLGSKLLLKTKTERSDKTVVLETDWGKYEELSKQYDLVQNSDFVVKDDALMEDGCNNNKKFFTDIENRYWFEDDKIEYHGTELEISHVNEIWTDIDLERAYQELSKLVSPIKKLKYLFNISIKSNEYEKFRQISVKNKVLQYATEEITLNYDIANNTQDILNFSNGKLNVIQRPIREMGPVAFKLYYFDEKGKQLFRKEYKGEQIDGIKIYRDGIITTPFAEYETKRDKRRDILGIDKRRWSGFWEKVSSQDLIGILDITKKNNPNIVDATNRQDFVDHKDYRELKAFIIEQLGELENYLNDKKKKEREKTKSSLNDVKEDLNNFAKAIKQISEEVPSLKQHITPIEKQVKKVQADVNKGIQDFNKLEKEKVQQENIFLSLMSLQEYALEISHVVRTSLSKIKRLAEFFKTEFPNPEYNDIFKEYAVNIYNEMTALDKGIDFLLSYAGSNSDFVEINIKNLIENLINVSYKHTFEKEKIRTIIEINKPLIITHNKKFFEDIIENLISNSIKALKKSEDKIIKCTGVVEKDKFVLYFSDNGVGIKKEDRKRIFNIYFTTTAEESGAGLGLFIVKKRIEALKGNIEAVDSEFKPNGATFKIVLPFKQRK